MSAPALGAPAATDLSTVDAVLRAHAQALHARGARRVTTYETQGSILGLGLRGRFHEWREGDRERRDDELGIRSQRQLRVGDTIYVQNASGDVRVLHGLLARREVTENVIDGGAIVAHPEMCTYIGPATLYDGRQVVNLRVAPPGGEPYIVSFDAKTFLVDQKSFVDGDSNQTVSLSDYAVQDGVLYAKTEVDSDGEHAYDVTSTVDSMTVGGPIAADVFAPLQQVEIATPTPVQLPIRTYDGLIFTTVSIHGKPFTFLIDSGAQGIVLDPDTAKAVGVHPEGVLQIRGAARTVGNGVGALATIELGTASLPVRVVSVVDLSHLLDSGIKIDGVLGYPLFAASELRINPDKQTITLAKPGGLQPEGSSVNVDTDRELLEVDARVNSIGGRFFIDTGNAGELLLFKPFLDAHTGALPFVGGHQVSNRGIGGSNRALSAVINQLDLGAFHLYNRNANMILASAGAFADRNDAGNIGYGVLKNFITTFDLASHRLYLDPARTFDDGRFRTVTEPTGIPR